MIKKIMPLVIIILCSACSPERAEQESAVQSSEVAKKTFKKKVWDPAAVMTEMKEKRKEKAREKIKQYLVLLSDIDSSNYIVKDNTVMYVKSTNQQSEDDLATLNLAKNVYDQVMPRAQLPEGAKVLVIRKEDVIEVIFDKPFEEEHARSRNSKVVFVDRKTNKVIGTQIGL